MQSAIVRSCRILTVLGVMTAMCGPGLLAAFMTPATATPYPEQMSESVKINLRGRVMPRCVLTGTEAPAAENISQSGISQIRHAFEVNCNAPFVVTLASANGGLRHEGQDRDEGVVAYEASLQILTDGGKTLRIDCSAKDLALAEQAAGCTGASGDDTAIGKTAVLTVHWDAPRDVAAGEYTDDLQLGFSVQD